MRIKRLVGIFVCMIVLLGSMVGFAFTAGAEETSSEGKLVQWKQGEGGICITDSLSGGVHIDVKEDAEKIPDGGGYGNTVLSMISFKLSEPIDATNATEWDGFLIRMKNTSKNNLSFNAYLLSDGTQIGRNYNSSVNRYEVFMDADGKNYGANDKPAGIQTRSGYYILTGGLEGTWNYKFDEIIANRPNMTAVDEIMFGLRMGDDAMKGRGLVIDSIAVYKEAVGGEAATVKTLFHSGNLTVSKDAADTTAGINLADYDKGTIVNTMRPPINNTGTFIGEEYLDELKPKAKANISMFLEDYSLTVRYEDEDGNNIQTALIEKHGLGDSYEITPPEIEGYTYKSASTALTGTISDDTIITLVYESDGSEPETGVTEVEYEVTESGLMIKDSLLGGVSMQTIEGMELIPDDKNTYGNTILAMVRFNLSQMVDGTEASAWDGLLIRMKNTAGIPLKFNVHTLSNGQVGRNYVSSDVRAEVFIDEKGENLADTGLGITTASGYPTISANASGTWNYKFDDLKHNRPDMNAIEAILFGLRMGDKTFDGYGLVIGSIAVYKEDASAADGYTVKTLFNAKDLVISEDETDATAGLNLANTDLGTVVTTDCPAINNTGTFVAEEYREMLHEKILAGLNIQQQGCEIRVNFLDKDGDAIASSVNLNVPLNETYTITPKEIAGYVYDSSDLPLTGTVTGNMEVNLTYKLQEFTITISFQDESGKKIKDDVTKIASMQEYVTIDIEELGAIDGYTFKECKGKLNFTVMRDETVVLVYSKNAPDVNIGLIVGCIVGGLAVVGAAVAGVVIVKKKRKSAK